jgi:hypothetical protein
VNDTIDKRCRFSEVLSPRAYSTQRSLSVKNETRIKRQKTQIMISGNELSELKRHSSVMAEAFGLDRRIDNYQGKRSIGLYRLDLDCLIDVIDIALYDPREYPERTTEEYKALKKLHNRLKDECHKNFE